MSEWKPIETAPDNVSVLAFTNSNQTVVAMKFEGRWCIGGVVATEDGLTPHAEFKIFFTPSHWMPLPPPPEAKP